MDLPTCPNCGQSVIDDEAENCPFCGSAMKGPPTGRKPIAPAKPAAKATSAATAAPAAEKPTRKPDDDEDPFATDHTALQQAVPASPKPMKGRTHKVVCPMCETVGYVPEKAAGQDVKCANPKCLVPIFKAPEVEKKPEVVEEEPKPRITGGMFVGGSLALLALVAAGVYFFVLKPPEPPPSSFSNTPVTRPGTGTDQQPVVDPLAEADGKKKDAEPRPVQAPVDYTAVALNQMIESSLNPNSQRDKPFCRQLTAEAFAILGRLDEAHDQLNSLRQVGSDVPYYQVPPLAQIAWRQLERKDQAGANKTLDTAVQVAEKMPKVGRAQLDWATSLASALVGAERLDQAASVLKNHQSDEDAGQLSALLSIARSFQLFDLNEAARYIPATEWAAPQHVAATLSVAAHGQSDLARQWAQQGGSDQIRAESLAAWAESLTRSALRQKQSVPQAQIEEAVRNLSPSSQAFVWARVAMAQLDGQDQAAATQTLATAQSRLSEAPKAEPFVLPDMRGILRLKLPDPEPLRLAARAAAEVAHVQARLGQTDAAWDSVRTALNNLRAIAPTADSVRQLLDEVDRVGLSAMRDRLRKLMELRSDDEARRMLNTYRKILDDTLETAQTRFEWERQILRQAMNWGLAEQVWGEIKVRAGESDASRREAWFDTPLPALLRARFQADNKTDLMRTIEAAAGDAAKQLPPREALPSALQRAVEKGDAKAAAQAANLLKGNDSAWRDRWVLTACSRLVERNKLPQAFALVMALQDPLLREDADELIAALATKKGAPEAVWKQVGAVSQAREKVALCRGLLAGLVVSGKAGEAAKATATTAAK